MLAAALAAEDDKAPVPQDLLDAWDCQRYNVPFDGISLMDQPAGKIQRMNSALNVFDAFDSRRRAIINGMDMREWSEQYPRTWRIVGKIERMRFDNRS